MAYQPNIPLGTDLISNSQGDIQGNFQAIGTAFNNTGTGFNQITFQGATAPGAPGVGSGIEFAKLGSADTVLFAANIIPWFINAAGSYPLMPDLLKNVATNDYSFKIGPILINCGWKTQLTGVNSYAITYKTAFSTAVLYKGIQPTNINSWSNGSSVSATGGPADLAGFTAGFQLNTTAGAGSYIYYLAIGY